MVDTIFHQHIPSIGFHTPMKWTFANQSARDSFIGTNITDMYKMAHQLSDNSLQILIGTTPPIQKQFKQPAQMPFFETFEQPDGSAPDSEKWIWVPLSNLDFSDAEVNSNALEFQLDTGGTTAKLYMKFDIMGGNFDFEFDQYKRLESNSTINIYFSDQSGDNLIRSTIGELYDDLSSFAGVREDGVNTFKRCNTDSHSTYFTFKISRVNNEIFQEFVGYPASKQSFSARNSQVYTQVYVQFSASFTVNPRLLEVRSWGNLSYDLIQPVSPAPIHILDNPNAYSTGTGDEFGISADICDSYSIVGAYHEGDTNGLSAGKAYIFDNVTGNLLHTLDNPNAYGTSTADEFGISVAICESYSIVGAHHEDDLSGSISGKAYIFDNVTGNLLHTLDNPNTFGTGTDDTFGFSVDICEQNAIVGAYKEDTATYTEAGIAYVFDTTSGGLTMTINNPDEAATATPDYFGYEVSIMFDGQSVYATIGATGDWDHGMNAGRVYVFNITAGATYARVIDNPDSTRADDYFGSNIAANGGNIVIGAPVEASGGLNSGKAYIMNKSNGNLIHVLTNPNPYGTEVGDQFGESVAISEHYVAVSSPKEDQTNVSGSSGVDTGKVYIYDILTGELLQTIENPNPRGTVDQDKFGFSIAMTDTHLLCCAIGEDDGALNVGKAYIYSIT